MMQHLTLDKIDHALEWFLRRRVTLAGYWPDVQALHEAGATAQQLQVKKDEIVAAGRELVEVFGVAPWSDRGVMKGNNIVVSRLITGTGSYARADLQEAVLVDPANPALGYRTMEVAANPHNVRYEVRFVADDSKMDRVVSQLILAAFGTRRYLYGINDDLSPTEQGFTVVPVGDSVDLSEDDFTERLWRIEVQDVHLIPAVEVDRVAAATDLGLDLEAGEQLVSTAY